MTNAINRLYSRFTVNLSQASKIDGRLLLLTLLIVYFLPIIFAVFSNSYSDNSKWIYPLVPKMSPPFMDMRVITAGSECIRLGYDVLIENPCDPLLRQMNYPRIWSIPATWGIDQSHTLILGILCGLLFFISIFFIVERLNYIQATIYALIICSPSVMLAVERGNIDTIMFILLTISLIALKGKNLTLRIFGYLVIFSASILKLYPIFALVTCIKEKRSIFIFSFLAILTAFIVYVISDLETLKLISKATPRPTSLSYGGMVIFDVGLSALVKRFPSLLDSQIAITIKNISCFVVIAWVFLTAYLAARKSETLNENVNQSQLEHIDSFRIGAAVYIGTFLIGHNWDYRLSFLIFTIPQLFAWIKNCDRLHSQLAALALGGIILTVWLSSGKFRSSYADEVINWLVFVYFAYMLILTLPKWLKDYVYFQPKNSDSSI